MLNEKDYQILYPKVKDFVIKYECGGNVDRLDEDVFHETAYNCLQIMRGKWLGVEEEVIIKYFCRAYRMNVIRRGLYFRNKNEKVTDASVIERDGCLNESCEEVMDLESIGAEILSKFPKHIALLFKRHTCDDVPIAVLQRESGISNLKYQFSKIRAFLKTNGVVRELASSYGYVC